MFRSLLVLLLALGPLPSRAKLGQHQEPPSSWLVGTWKLVSTEDRLANGSTRPYPAAGPNGIGYLIYAADGHMCAGLMNPDRAKWNDANNPSVSEKTSALDGFVGYCGRYEVDEAQKAIYHYPDVAWMPNYVGTKQRRPYTLEGDLLTFADTVTNEAGVASYVIVWRKVRNDR